MRLDTFVAGDAHARQWLMGLGDIVQSLLPAMVKLKVVTAEQVGIETLRDRLLQEVVSNGSVVVGRSEIGIWTTVQRDDAV